VFNINWLCTKLSRYIHKRINFSAFCVNIIAVALIVTGEDMTYPEKSNSLKSAQRIQHIIEKAATKSCEHLLASSSLLQQLSPQLNFFFFCLHSVCMLIAKPLNCDHVPNTNFSVAHYLKVKIRRYKRGHWKSRRCNSSKLWLRWWDRRLKGRGECNTSPVATK